MIDGRSNAHAAFAQKCQLLRDYKTEFGDLNTIPKSTYVPPSFPTKYRQLIDFIAKQRKCLSCLPPRFRQLHAHDTRTHSNA